MCGEATFWSHLRKSVSYETYWCGYRQIHLLYSSSKGNRKVEWSGRSMIKAPGGKYDGGKLLVILDPATLRGTRAAPQQSPGDLGTGRHFKRLLKKAGLPAIRLHDLRHTCATILLMAGKHPKYVQELLGHASINITLDTYSHVIEGMDGGLADAMDDTL
jgi:integrase